MLSPRQRIGILSVAIGLAVATMYPRWPQRRLYRSATILIPMPTANTGLR